MSGTLSSIRLAAPSGVYGAVRAPTSKSYTNRALVLSALAKGTSRLVSPLESDDTMRMGECLRAMSIRISHDNDAWLVEGSAGKPASPEHALNAGLSGTTLRFLAAVAPLTPTGATVTGLDGLLRRPVGPLSQALRQLGADVHDQDGLPPVVCGGGGLRGGSVVVDARQSSQFATAVLMVAPCAAASTHIKIANLSNPGYIDMTLDSMRVWGARFEEDADGSIHIPGGQVYQAQENVIEFDASAAMHLLALAMASGGRVSVENASPDTKQPDAKLLSVFELMGARIEIAGSLVTLQGPDRPLACEVDLGGMPDQVPTLAVLAALSEGVTSITNVALVRGHETDRLAALAVELRKVGAEVDELPDGLRIQGSANLKPASIDTYGDHRMAMAFAALAARIPGLVIEDPGVVSKTYPRFWEDVAGLGIIAS